MLAVCVNKTVKFLHSTSLKCWESPLIFPLDSQWQKTLLRPGSFWGATTTLVRNDISPNDLFKKHEPIPASFGLFSFFTAIIFADKLYTSAGYELRSLEASTLTTWPPPPWLCIIDLKEHFWKAQFIPVTVIL